MPNLDFKYITDENGNRVLPITHVNAVRDSSGNTLPSLMVPEKNGSGIGTCSTSSGTALTVSLTGYELVTNGFVAVTFEHDVPANATLNVNSKGAKPIIYKGAAIEADVIKADDTVMFAYDGTNYVVTSLGSSTCSGFVTISLTHTSGKDSDLIGVTIVVTDNDTSETILSTTWQGSKIVLKISEGVDYTVTVGNVSGYTVSPNYQSYTAVGGMTRDVSFAYLYEYYNDVVDLGLPSGTLWAKGNIVKDGNNYEIGSERNYGAFVSWGNVTPHFSTNDSTFDDGYTFSDTNYNSSPGASITSASYPNTGAVYAPNSGYDAARELLGGMWRTPTNTDYNELNDYCTSEWISRDGIYGMEFTSNINGAKIFFPAAGFSRSNGPSGRGGQGYYWSSSLASSGAGYHTSFSQGSFTPNFSSTRYTGLPVRPVI